MLAVLQRICPHRFGWSYNTHRRRRWCRLCAQQQRLDPGSGRYVDVTTERTAA